MSSLGQNARRQNCTNSVRKSYTNELDLYKEVGGFSNQQLGDKKKTKTVIDVSNYRTNGNQHQEPKQNKKISCHTPCKG